MVCEVCSVDRTNEGELVILDYPRYLASESPCLNCGSGAPRQLPAASREMAAPLRTFVMAAVDRRRARGVERRSFTLGF